jgi:predicted nucleic acid-binding protein
LTALGEALSGVKRLAVDTAPIIYFIEENPKYLTLMDEVFERIATGSLTAITSAITLTEVLTHPLRLGNEELRKS